MKITVFLALCISLFFTGCIKDVKPWEKGTLSKKTVKESGINPILNQFEEHIYFSKEASKGGGGISGGGCGCN